MIEKGTEWKVLDKGYVKFLDVMGDDQAIADAARLSYGKGTRKVSDDEHLIRYLIRHYHTSPLEQAELKFLIKCPIYIWRQWIRHRASKFSNINEYSGRYSEMIDECEQTSPDAWRLQSSTNKQGSSGLLEEWPNNKDGSKMFSEWIQENSGSPGNYLSEQEDSFITSARSLYEQRLEMGVAREQARKDLPLSNYTLFVWKIDLHNLLHFLSLRMDSHAQLEIRSYANIIGNEIVSKLFPITWEAFNDYRLNAISLTALDIQMLELITTYNQEENHNDSFYGQIVDKGIEFGWFNFNTGALIKSREREEFEAKAAKINIEVPWDVTL